MGSLPAPCPAITGRAGAATARRRPRPRAAARRAALLPGAGDGGGAGGPARRRRRPRRRPVAARRGRGAVVPARQRRPRDDRQPAARPRGAGHRSKCGSSTTRAPRGREPAETAALFARVLRAARGPGASRLRRLGGRRRRAGHRLADGRPGPAAAGRGARAYLVQDHEPEFYPTSAERDWAEWTYRLGLHCIAASPWLAGLLPALRRRARRFDLGVDHERYRPAAVAPPRRTSCSSTPARSPRGAPSAGPARAGGAPRRRPRRDRALRRDAPDPAPFPHRRSACSSPTRWRRPTRGGRRARAVADQPVADPDRRCWPAACRASTWPARACSRPRRRRPVDAGGARPARAVRRDRGPARRPRAARPPGRRGLRWAAARTWPAAAAQVEDGLRAAMREAARP